ncbi:hypothetical protein KPL70_026087 [Citrus sinensis]|nr:hypothetical protein KPL70_026087 [Citrus sinensis]
MKEASSQVEVEVAREEGPHSKSANLSIQPWLQKSCISGAFIAFVMTDSDLLKTIQEQIESQTLSLHQTLQQYMATVDSRLDDLRSQIHGSSNHSSRVPHPPHPTSSSTEVNSSGIELSPMLRSMKMEVPKFDGSDPNGWVFRIEEFFDFHGTPETLRLRIVSFHMEGRATAWYQWMKMNSLLTTWKEFLQNLKHHFGASLYEDPQGNLSKLSQTTTVAEFQTSFEDLMNRVTGISEPLLISFFITGLKSNIRRELLFARPSSLMEAFALARAYEARAEEAKQGHRFLPKWNTMSPTPTTTFPSPKFQPNTYPLASTQPYHSTGMAHTISHSHNTSPPPKPNTLPPPLPTPNLPIRRLTPAELRDKREKGLCYNCDSPPNHRCRKVITGDISSLNALAGQINPRSLSLVGEVGSHSFQVLIDSGSTHNFIKPAVAERLGLLIQPTANFRVYIGNGDFLVCKYVCPKVALTMQGTVFTLDLFVLPIEGPDVVLGKQWLQLLGRVSHDYSALSMEFYWNGAPVTLRGELSTTPSLITFHQLQSLVHSADIYSLFALQQVPVPGEESESNPDSSSFELPPHLTTPFVDLLHTYRNLFLPPTTLPPHRTIDHRIHLLPNTTPINVRPYRYPHFQKNEMEKLIREMLEQGIIQPSQSPFSSPVLLVKKKDGTYRFCVDYRALNAATIKDKFPIPTIDELFDELGGAAIFSKLDLRAGYHQIRVHHRDIYKTAFRTHEGHYEFLVMLFGATAEEHLRHLQQVLWCLHFHQFFVKLSKCLFCQDAIDYLGHIVSASGVRADPQKITAMVRWPTPQTTKKLRGFLGLTSYYRRFIHGYASLAAPLTDLLCKDAFQWTPAAADAFEALKRAMVEAPVLRLPDFDSDFILETDASNVGIGAVLMQSGHPISYFSKKLGPRLRASSTYIKELTAIVEAVHKWRQYLLGRFFVIRTDHKSIKELLQQVVQTPDQQVYIRKLLGYHFRIEYKPSCTNLAADALSRIHDEAGEVTPTVTASCLPFLSRPSFKLLATLTLENSTLPEMINLHQQFAAGSLSRDYSLHNGVLFYRNRYYISPSSSLKAVLLAEFHSTPLAGHVGIKRTLVRLASNFFWPKMRMDVERFVAECLVRQQTKYSTQAPAGPLQPLPIPTLVWDELTMDFITGLPVSRGFMVILVVVDRLTKSAHFGSLPTQFTAVKTAELFVDMVIKPHGFPTSIISDRDLVFLSNFWKKLFELSGTTLRHSTAYQPQTNGQLEVVNRGLEQYLRAFTQDKPHSWVSLLGWAEFSYNSTYHSSIKMSPFQALFGRPPPAIALYSKGSTSIQALDEALSERDALLRSLKENLRQAQHRMIQKANAHRREAQFAVGDQVLVKLQPYRQNTMASCSCQKLAKRYYGPFPVLARVGPVAYRLALPSGSKIHPVFHISLLKPFLGSHTPDQHSLPSTSVDNQLLYLPAAVCAIRTVLKQGTRCRQILVQWQASSPEDSTWEEFDTFCKLYPDFHLEDKVNFEAGGDDTTFHIQLDQPDYLREGQPI